MSTVSFASMLSSADRPIPLQARPDLKAVCIQFQTFNSWVVKDPVGLKYFRFQPEQYKILALLDGQRSLDEIRSEFQKEFPTVHLSHEEIQNLITDLHKSGLVYSNRPGQGTALLDIKRENQRKKFLQALKSILFIRVPGWDPERSLDFLFPFFRWMYTPFGVFLWLAVVLSAAVLLAVQFDEFQSKLPGFKQFFGWPNLMYMWIVLGGAKVIHEFGHGLSCKAYGGECHEMGVMFLVLSPCLYCDVSDSWLLQNKWKRIMIAAAGMYIEMLLSSLAIFGWWYSQPGLFNYLCLNLFFVSAVSTVIFNANPLMRYDGYYMLADFLEIPNLRPKADRTLREKFAWYCLGIESRPDPFMPQSGTVWFMLFAIAAAVYKWFILAAIMLFFYSFLKPQGLQSIGIALATFSVVSIVVMMGVTIYQIISAPRLEPMSTPKITATLSILGIALIAALMIPFPWSLQSALVIEPHDVQHVYTVTPGQLLELKVAPGDQVKKGQVLARLSNYEKEQEYVKLQYERKVQKIEIELQHTLQNFAREKLAHEKLQTLELQIQDYEEQLSKLTILAPVDGKIVAPPRVRDPKLEVKRTKLVRWHGTPLEPRNGSAYLEPRTHLLSVAPSPEFDALLLVDQADRNDIAVGQDVRIKLDHLPARTFRGKILEVSEKHMEFAPTALTNKAGGDLATVTDEQGREKLTSTAYQAIVRLPDDADLMKSGLRGRAKFVVATRSVGDWLKRYLTQTFRFRL